MGKEKIKKVIESYEKEIEKTKIDLNLDKKKFISELKGGLGNKMMDYNTYVKKSPSKLTLFFRKIKKIFKYL